MLRTSKKGVTLIELTIVLLITVVMLSIGAAAFLPVEKRQLQKAAQDLKNEIRYIQRMALAEKNEYRLAFDLGTKSNYSVFKLEADGDKLVSTAYFPSGVTLHAENLTLGAIRFTQKGTIDRASTVILVSGKYNIALTCALGTGNVIIYDIKPKSSMYRLSDFN